MQWNNDSIRPSHSEICMGYMQMYKGQNSFSLAFLRHDQKFSSVLGSDSGFIIYPHLKTPKHKNTYRVYCSFPYDAVTGARRGHGCGTFNNNQMSNHCDKLGVKSYHRWKSYFHANLNRLGDHCAFDMTKTSAAKYFDISLRAKRHMAKHNPGIAFNHNELKMQSWTSKAKKIPIEAFFLFARLCSWKN